MEAAPRHRAQGPSSSSWSDIPAELAGLVLGRLAARVDRVRFAAVCPQWRSAAARQGPLPPPLPLLVLPDATAYSLPGSEPFRFPGCAGYTGACDNWLVFSGEDSCFLKDPLSKATVTLPALSRVRVRRVGDEPVDEASLPWTQMGGREELSACKIMLCSPRLIAATVSFMRVAGESTEIAVCQPGATSWWSIRLASLSPHFRHMASHQGMLYAITDLDELFAVEISVDDSTGDPRVSQIQQVISGTLASPYMIVRGAFVIKVTYLVESRGALLVVCQKVEFPPKPGQGQMITERDRFEVFEANFGQSRWTKVATLGDDQVLFVCRQCARSVLVSHDEVPGDRIFFMDNELGNQGGNNTSVSCSVYNMRDGKVSTHLPLLSWKRGKVFATWLFPQD